MATSYHKFRGTARFIKAYEPDDFMGAKRYKAGIYPDEKSLQEFKNSGIQKGIKEDENGKYFEVTRDQTRTFDDRITKFSPPIIYDKDGTTLVQYVDSEGETVRSWELHKDEAPKPQGERVLIGNGSEIELSVAVFDTRKGKGQRLESIRIIDLIEYKKPEIIEPEETFKASEEMKADVEAAVKPKAKGKAPW